MLPDGTLVQSAGAALTGAEWLPRMQADHGAPTLHSAAGAVASGITRRLVSRRVAGPSTRHGSADVESVEIASDSLTVRAQLAVSAEHGVDLEGFDVAGVARAAAADSVGTFVPYGGRITACETTAPRTEHSGQATTYVIPVTLTLATA